MYLISIYKDGDIVLRDFVLTPPSTNPTINLGALTVALDELYKQGFNFSVATVPWDDETN